MRLSGRLRAAFTTSSEGAAVLSAQVGGGHKRFIVAKILIDPSDKIKYSMV